jgi:hypothetical protein
VEEGTQEKENNSMTATLKEIDPSVLSLSASFIEPDWGEDMALALDELIVERYEDKPGRFYQRGITHVKDSIVENYFPRAFGRVTVVEIGEDKYAIVDGQNRTEAARELGFTHVPCIVHRNLTLKQRAYLFWHLNTQSKTLRPVQKFHAAVASGDSTALKIKKLLDEFEITVIEGSTSKSSLSAITTVIYVYNTGGEAHLRRTLSIITKAWPDERKRFQNSIIGGISQFLKLDKEQTNDDKLSARLATYSVSDVNKQGSDLHQGVGHGGHSHIYVARGIAIFLYGGKAKNTWPEKKNGGK